MSKKCGVCLKSKPDHAFHLCSGASKRKSVCIACVKKTRHKTCPSCGVLHGSLGRMSRYCPICWPAHRQATNLYGSAKYRSAQRGMSFDLTVPWIEERLRLPCSRTGAAFDLLSKSYRGFGDRSPYAPSLDQIHPAGGYTKDNIQVVCWWYNAAKQQFSDDEVLDLCRRVVNQAL